ncbi:MAG: DUF2304 domain-containing protein [Thermodesulfovibrionia bacterium]|nr:DUF2304 domain-containing protein [Thermodesulfovibrionia bacterium]
MQLVQILSILISFTVLILVIEAIRRGLLKEKYALLWLFASIVIITLSVWRKLLDTVAFAFGFYYPPSFLFLIGLGFLLLIALHFSIIISTISERNKRLAQELGIVKTELKQIKRGVQKSNAKDYSQERGHDT